MKANVILIAIVLALTAPSFANGADPVDWSMELSGNLPLLGHRNFIVIADSA